MTITLAPTRFDTVSSVSCSYGFARTGIIVVTPPGVTGATHEKFSETTYSNLDVAPRELEFLLTVRNGMSRVFRGAGAVVQFNVDQRAQAVEQSSYVDLLNALIPPGGERQIRISGPPLTALRDSVMLGVFLFDVVTDIDKAGTVAKRENFEWYFRVSRDHISQTVIGTRRNVWVPKSHVAEIAEVTPEGGRRLLPNRSCIRGIIPQ